MKPAFLIPGFGKCGTTTLAALLAEHPQICMASKKEPDFLSNEDVYRKGWEWYENLFDTNANTKAAGEASVSYLFPDTQQIVSERILEYLPSIKLIIMVRNPFDRLESVYREVRDNGHHRGWVVPANMSDAFSQLPFLLEEGCYWSSTEHLRSAMAAEQLMFVFCEDLKTDQEGTLRSCYEFLEVDVAFAKQQSVLHLNARETKYQDKYITSLVRNNALFATIYRNGLQPFLNSKAQNLITRLTRKEFGDENLEWSADFRKSFVDLMKPEVKKLLLHCGRRPNYWGEEFR